jgi:hypothetical protein
MPDNIEERPAWYLAEINRMKRQQTKGHGREDRRRANIDANIVERYWWAKAHPERAAEVDVTFGDKTLPLRELVWIEGAPVYVPVGITRPSGSL